MAQLRQWIRSDFGVPVGIDDIRFVSTLLDICEQLPIWMVQVESSHPSSIGNLVSIMHSNTKSGSMYDWQQFGGLNDSCPMRVMWQKLKIENIREVIQ